MLCVHCNARVHGVPPRSTLGHRAWNAPRHAPPARPRCPPRAHVSEARAPHWRECGRALALVCTRASLSHLVASVQGALKGWVERDSARAQKAERGDGRERRGDRGVQGQFWREKRIETESAAKRGDAFRTAHSCCSIYMHYSDAAVQRRRSGGARTCTRVICDLAARGWACTAGARLQ